MSLYHGFPVLGEIEETCPDHGTYKRFQTRVGVRGQCPACEELGEQRKKAEEQAQQRARWIVEYLRLAWLPERFKGKGFDAYEPRTDAQRKALRASRQYVEDIQARVEAGAGLVLIGPPGVGKTHLLAGLVESAVRSLCFSRYTTMTGYLSAIKGCWAWHGAELGRDFLEPTLLVVDEIWKPQSDRDRESMLALLDERYRANKPTIIGSNLLWPEMKTELGERFCDRLLEGGGLVLQVDGKSMRATV